MRTRLNSELTKLNRRKKLDTKKGSRYGFPCYLILIKKLMG